MIIFQKRYLKNILKTLILISSFFCKSFTFTSDETIIMDGDKRTFPKNESERYDYGRKRLKYLVLGRYSELLDDREKNTSKAGYVVKADTALEREARMQITKQMDRYFST